MTASATAVARRSIRRRPAADSIGGILWSSRVSVTVLVVLIASACLASVIAPYGPDAIDPLHAMAPPSGHHLFGTDILGRDTLSRVLYGGRLSLGIAAAGTVIAIVLGSLWGAAAALVGGFLDEAIMRLADTVMGIPVILWALIFVSAFSASLTGLIVILGLLHVPITARIVRAAVMSEQTMPYATVAVAGGAGRMRLLFREFLPNLIPTLLVQSVLVAASIILTEASLSFLGLGIQPPQASWGTLVYQGYQTLYQSVWPIVFPGVAIVLTIWSMNALADRMQAALDPSLRQAAPTR